MSTDNIIAEVWHAEHADCPCCGERGTAFPGRPLEPGSHAPGGVLFSCWKCSTGHPPCMATVPSAPRKPDKQQDQWQRLGGRFWARWTVSGIDIMTSDPVTSFGRPAVTVGNGHAEGHHVAIERADLDALRVFLDRVAEVLG